MNDLRPITLNDLNYFKDCFARGGQKGWVYFFPLLYFFSQGKNRELLFCEDSGFLCLYLHKWKKQDEAKKGNLDLFFPPVPMNGTALKNAIVRMNDFNHNDTGRIVWIEEQDVDEIVRASGFAFEVTLKGEEYLYDPKCYRELAGGRFAKMRKSINRLERLNTLEVVPYDIKYAEECLVLLRQWEAFQGRNHDYVDDRAYTRKCLEMAGKFREPDLVGKIISVDNKIKSFGFVGKMYEQMSCGFIVKSDHSIPDLNNYMLSKLMIAMESADLVNGASDLGHPGLRFAKQKLRPVGMVKTFTAKFKQNNRDSTVRTMIDSHPETGSINKETDFLFNELEGLREISVSDVKRYKEALEKTPQRTWMNYFPSLLFLNSTTSRSILMGVDNGSLCIYLLIHWPRHNRLHLYLPPMPMDLQVLQRCFQRINAFNGDLRGSLLWISQSLKDQVLATDLFTIKEFDQEFIYEPESFQELSGSRFRVLRNHLRKAERNSKIIARPFTLNDRAGCLILLEKWRKTLTQKGIAVDGYSRSRTCINTIAEYSVEDLHGRVYEIDGMIRGFAFGGHLAGQIGCSFVHVSDHDIPSLGYYVPYEFMKNMRNFSVVNEAGTGGLEGLTFMKTNLSPVRLEPIFRGKQKQRRTDDLQVEKHLDVMGGLKRLSYEDHEIFQRCLAIAGRKSWVSCFPFLCSFNRRKQHSLYWELYRGSICLYFLKEHPSGKRLSLYFLPFPYRDATLAYAMEKVNQFNRDRKGEIVWVEEIDCDDIIRLGYGVRSIESEYIYTKESFDGVLKYYDVQDNITTRQFGKADEEPCLNILEKWRAGYIEQGGGHTGYYYKKACILDAIRYSSGDLVGEVLLVDGSIQGVCFAGIASADHAIFYVTVTALEYADLQVYQHARIAEQYPAYFYNNSDDRYSEVKRSLTPRPTGEHQLYRARQPVRKRAKSTMGEVKDKNTALYIMAARELDLKVDIISSSYSYCTISNGAKMMHVYHNSTSISDVATRKVTHHKYLSQNLLRTHGIPVPDAKVFGTGEIENILKYVETRKPVVIKPLKGSNSVGVTVAPSTAEEIREAVARIESDKVMVERYIHGESYRILICKGVIIDVIRWCPPYIVGNGLDSIHELIELKNNYYLANGLHIIEIDFEYLESQGFEIGFVPKRGQWIFLNKQSEHFVGGETVRIDLNEIHPVNNLMFLKISSVSGLSLAGVDFISEDISIPYTLNGAGINEINSTPHIWPHFFAEQKEDLRAVKAILGGYFSQ